VKMGHAVHIGVRWLNLFIFETPTALIMYYF